MNGFKGLGPLLFLIFFSFCSFSQVEIDPADAKEHFKNRNYPAAIRVYSLLLKKDPSNPQYNMEIGICYLYSYIDRKQAITYLEKATKTPKPAPEVYNYLGQAYHINYEFDKAIDAYNTYKKVSPEAELKAVNRQIEMVENAKELVKHPLNVTFENLGPEINTEFPDYYPIVPDNEQYIIFTTRRKGGQAVMEFDGYYSSDVYISNSIDGKYEKAKSIGPTINTSYDEEAVGLSNDGDELFIYLDNVKEFGDIYISERKPGVKTFSKPVKLGENVNSNALETSATLSANGEVLLFSSKREGGYGGTDIYLTRKLPSGAWALPQNIGATVNTPYNEDFPQMDENGTTLYFASQGHNSMGGYDLFISEFDTVEKKWSKPRNLGYPINTPDNNMTISFSGSGRSAYLSDFRSEGLGNLDVYRVTFNEAEKRLTMIRGTVACKDSTIKQVPDASISVFDPDTEDEVGSYKPNPYTQRYVMALPPGKYRMEVMADGFKTLTEELVIGDHNAYKPEIIKDLKLAKSP